MIDKKQVKCDACSYSWLTASKMKNVNCPSCLKKVKIK